MMASTAAVVIVITVLLLQDTSLKPVFTWPSENSTLQLKIIQPTDAAECHNNTDDYFNRNYFHLKSYISYEISSRKMACNDCVRSCDRHRRLLREYKKKNVVRCLDFLSIKKKRRPTHIAFIGDSTVRQHFVSFMRWIPDYDRKISRNSTMYAEYYFHEDRNITIPLMDNLLVSFYWRRLIKEDLINDFKRWASTDDDNQAPDFIFLGVTAHHIAENQILSMEMYEKLLENNLMPLINKSLVVHPYQEIIWLQQSPTIENFNLGIVYPEMIAKYNEKIRRIFKNTRVVMWDAINAVVEEYIRACALTKFERQDKEWCTLNVAILFIQDSGHCLLQRSSSSTTYVKECEAPACYIGYIKCTTT